MDIETSLTIKVNISAPDWYEGNSEFSLTLPEKHLKYLDRNKLATELDRLITEALDEYNHRNQ